MRAKLMLVVPMTAAISLTTAAQQIAPPAVPAQKVEPVNPVVTSAKRTRTARIKHHKSTYVSRSYLPGGPADICRVMNGWRAFRNRYDPNGYFYTGRVTCYR
jgi:hypothetical protein